MPGGSDYLGCELVSFPHDCTSKDVSTLTPILSQNPYRLGDKDFYGPSKTLNTNYKFTVVTQFIGNPIQQIKRFYCKYFHF